MKTQMETFDRDVLRRKNFLSQTEAAFYLGIKWETLRKWAALNLNLPVYRFPDPEKSRPKYKVIDLDRYLEKFRTAPRPRMKEKRSHGPRG